VIVDDHRCAGLAEPLGRRRAYSPARAGNENGLFTELQMFLLLGHAAKKLDGHGIFRRALFVLGCIVLERQELHLHIGRSITI
jgi:hypothetical protein